MSSKTNEFQFITGFDYLATIDFSSYNEIYQIYFWLSQHFKDRWRFIPGTGYRTVAFRCEEERNWFILRWS